MARKMGVPLVLGCRNPAVWVSDLGSVFVKSDGGSPGGSGKSGMG